MTKEQFFIGWTILTTQPWGRAYRGTTPEATIQVELYFKHVNKANPVVWQAVCEAAAMGQRWPSLEELKEGLRANGGYAQADRYALEDFSIFEWEEAPEPLSACFTYAKQNQCLITEAYRVVLPVWLKQNHGHENATRATRLLDQAKKNFGRVGKRVGNVEVPL